MRAASFLRSVLAALALAPLLAACTPVGLLVAATSVATDTSVSWDVVKHIHGQLTADDATPCIRLNGVQRALNARCEYVAGSIQRADIADRMDAWKEAHAYRKNEHRMNESDRGAEPPV